MNYRSEKNAWAGFSLIEAAAAVVILGIICTSVLVVINRAMASTVDSVLRMKAFEVARENMEQLLSSDSVSEMTEYGFSEKYPDITWQTTVETFYEPITNDMWLEATCLAEYTDTKGQAQTVELAHWLTKLSKQEIQQILAGRGKLEDFFEGLEDYDANEPAEPNSFDPNEAAFFDPNNDEEL